MMKKRMIVISSLIVVMGLFLFSIHMKNNVLYSLSHEKEVKMALEKVFHTSITEEMEWYKFKGGDSFYIVAGMYKNNQVYGTIFKEEENDMYRCLVKEKYKSGHAKILCDHQSHFYVGIGSYPGKGSVPYEVEYTNGETKVYHLENQGHIFTLIEIDPYVVHIKLDSSMTYTIEDMEEK